MDNELVQVIQQIAEELSQTSEWDIANVVIGAIGIILTIVVLVYNHKAIKLTQRSVQQAIDLQLFEKRLELYNAIAEDNAFYSAPLSLKIAYNEEIYQLYSDIVELCEKRWVNIWEFSQLFGRFDWENQEHGNVCDELYKKYVKEVESKIELRKKGYKFQRVNDRELLALEKAKATTNSLQQDICEKYCQLEEKMRKVLNWSINI